jgi:hypothetical protein
MAELKLRKPWQTDAAPDETSITGYRAPKLTMLEPQYHDVYNSWHANKSPTTTSALVKAVDPILDEATRSYAGGEANTTNAKTTAKRLAIEAFDRYDPDRAKLKTHLLSHLRGLRRVTQRATQAIYLPEQHRIDAQRLASSLPELTEQLGRHPSDAELADHTGLSLARLKKARAVPGVLTSGQVGDSTGVAKVDKNALDKWTEAIYHDSDPIDQIILERSLGLHGHAVMPAHEIAALVNLSPGGISQHKSRLQKQLDEFETFLGRANT